MIAEINTVDVLLNILQFVVPSLVVFGVTYTMLQKMLDQNLKSKELDIKSQKAELITPMKLQAYERLTLFLDRITPDQLVMRLAAPNMSAHQFKVELQRAISEEYAHNVSQQIYVSSQAWSLVKAVKEKVQNLIEVCYKDMNETSSATDLGKVIIQEVMERNENSTRAAIEFLKKELDIVF